MPTTGPILYADLLTMFDAWGGAFKNAYAAIGINAPGESNTLALNADTAHRKIMGDGVTYYGISNTDLQAQIAQDSKRSRYYSRYDVLFQLLYANEIRSLDARIFGSLPTGINFNDPSGRRPLDLYLLRGNGLHASTPPAPTGTPTLTATTGGRIPTGTGRRYKYAWIYNDGSSNRRWHESQPSAATTQVALSGKNSAYTLGAIQNPVPANVGGIAIYGQLVGAGSGASYFWEKDVAAVAGAAPPAITVGAADIELNQSWLPVAWLQALLLPEEAFLASLAGGSLNPDVGVLGLMQFSAAALLSAESIALNPVSGFLGEGNVLSDGTFAQRVVGTGFTQGAPLLASDYLTARQGFAGGQSVQARVTAALNANATLTNILYTYRDATHPTADQNGTIAGPLPLTSGLGSVIDLAIPAGQLVRAITGDSISGSASGTYIYESTALRAL